MQVLKHAAKRNSLHSYIFLTLVHGNHSEEKNHLGFIKKTKNRHIASLKRLTY